MDPWVIACAGGIAFALYEGKAFMMAAGNAKVQQSQWNAPKMGANRHPLEATYVNTQQNPWDKQEKIHIKGLKPAVAGLDSNPDVAGKWELVLPNGAMMQVYCSFNKLQQKVILDKC